MASALTPCATLWPAPENSKVTVRDSVRMPISSFPPSPPQCTLRWMALSRREWRAAQCCPLNVLHWTLTGPVHLCLHLPHNAEAPPAGRKDGGTGTESSVRGQVESALCPKNSHSIHQDWDKGYELNSHGPGYSQALREEAWQPGEAGPGLEGNTIAWGPSCGLFPDTWIIPPAPSTPSSPPLALKIEGPVLFHIPTPCSSCKHAPHRPLLKEAGLTKALVVHFQSHCCACGGHASQGCSSLGEVHG